MNLQPTLETPNISLQPLLATDFEALYAVASDPKIWFQHPNKDRWKKEVFTNFFNGAMKSKGAFKVVDKHNGALLGSTRFYDLNEQDSSIFIGYTFYAVKCWGEGINHGVKKLMLDYAFEFVSKVFFHIGAANIRSQVSISRLNAVKIDEQEVTYFGELPKLNYVYEISKANWDQKQVGIGHDR